MEEQLRLLVHLQEIDLKIRDLNQRKNRFPEILNSLEQKEAAGRDAVNKTREALEAAQKDKRDRDKDLEIGAQKIEKLKARTTEIKTNKEYQAQLKEIETAEQENKAIEDQILVLMEKIEAAGSAVKAAEGSARGEEAEIASERKKQEEEVAKIDEELKSAERERNQASSAVDPTVLSRYQKLLVTKGGYAVAEARGESCSGCYMSIPPQVYVNVKKNETFITCPNCSRFLYFKP